MVGRGRYVATLVSSVVLGWYGLAGAADFSGRAYEGKVGDESKQLPGVTVRLSGSVDAGGPRTDITSTTTDSSGWYSLTATEGFEYYFITAESGPDASYSFEGASSVDGSASGNEIQYSTLSQPLADQTLTGNKFWYSKESTDPPDPVDPPEPPEPGQNNPPVADAGGPYSAQVGNPVMLDGSGSYDPDTGDSITGYQWYWSSQGTYVPINGVLTTPTIWWVPPVVGQYTLQLEVTDSHGATDTDTSTIDVQEEGPPDPPGPGQNNRPDAKDDVASTAQNTAVDIDVLSNDSDPDGDPLHINTATDPAHGSVVNHGTHVTYTPDPGYSGTDTFDYTAGDGRGGTDTATVTVDVDDAGGPVEPPGGGGALDGHKRDADTGAGLSGWRIYIDLNGNGEWDGDEPSDVTDGSGYYRMADVEPGTYRVCEVMQDGWQGDHPCVEGIDVVAGIITTLDFHNRRVGGEEPPEGTGAIRGSKFHDLNGNGQRDAGEPGLEGWVIVLQDAEGNTLTQTTTDGEGDYAFAGQDPGVYRVDEVQQAGWRQTYPEVDGEGAYWAIGLEPGDNVEGTDFGNTRDGGGESSFIGDRVWEDTNENGLQDPGEPGIAGVSVLLLDAGGGQVATTATGAGGYYGFSDVAPGDYVVRFVLPAGYVFTDAHIGTDDTIDSDANPQTGESDPLIQGPGERDDTVDAGLVRDGDSPGGPGGDSVTVVKKATPADDTPFQFCVDYAPGGFFDVLCQDLQDPSSPQWTPSNPILIEKVTETVPAGWTLKDITITGDTDQGSVINLAQGSVDIDHDPGEHIVVVFENVKEGHEGLDYGDAPGSYGIASHSVMENLSMGAVIDREVTANTSPGAGGDDAHGLDDEDGMSFDVGLAPGRKVEVCLEMHNDGAMPRDVFVAGWIDFDGDGQFGFGAEHLFTTPVHLPPHSIVRNCEQIAVPTHAKPGTTFGRFRMYVDDLGPGVAFAALPTGAGGDGEVEDYLLYILSGAPGPDEGLDYGDAPASYGIASHDAGTLRLGTLIDLESNALFSANADGDDLDNTDDEDGVTLVSDLVPGQATGMHIAFTFPSQQPPDSVVAWIDFDQDGVFHNATERVNWVGGNVIVGAQSGGIGGSFQVPSTAKLGTTFMRVRVGSGVTLGPTGHGGPGEVEDYEVEVKGGGQILPPGAIFGGLKFNDLNGNGSRDPGEPGVANWAIWIDLNGNGVKDAGEETVTNSDGTFFFTALAPGTYTVYEESRNGWTQTYPGGAGAHTITIQAGQPVPSVAFGNRQTAGPQIPGNEIIHGYKWNDLDGDGLWDVAQPVEPPLANWTIWLDMNGDGVQDGGDLTTQTDAIGHFIFPPVASGTYVVGEVQQSGWTPTAPAGGTHTVTVQGGQGSNPLLFGNRQSGGPTPGGGGTIWAGKWNDLDGNGIYSLSEPLLANWQMYLDLNQNGQLDPGEPTQFTDANGECRFTGLADGTYVLAEVMQAGWQQTNPGGAGTYAVTVAAGGAASLSMFGNQQVGGPGPGPGPDPDQQLDWGDAPDPTYPTLRASGGASHAIVAGMHLGPTVSGEVDGQPHPEALGDDLDGDDDEDGVFFLTPLMPGENATVEVVVPSAGRLDAWIDFGADGSWAEPADQIFKSEAILDGANILTLPVPNGAVADVPTCARFRFSSAGGLAPGGAAIDGEVEDYCLVLGEHGPAVAGEPGPPHIKWSQPAIETDPDVEVEPVFCGWGEPARSTQSGGNRRQWRMDADDFRCFGPIPVTRIRWWGTYKAWSQPELPEGQPEAWHIGIWASQVEGLEPNESYPERLVWSVEVPFERVHFEPAGLSEFAGRLPATCFVYELGLEPEEWFHQAEFASHEDVFWITITAIYPPDAPGSNKWGWLTRSPLWGRGAVMPAIMGEWPSFDERLFPGRISPVKNSGLCGEDQGFDMCFELLTEEPWILWDQPFTGLRDWPWYADEMADALLQEDDELLELRVVADDWLCEREDPIVALSWHGSYIDYGYEACQCEQAPEPRRPDTFLLAMHGDAPADDWEPYEHPGEKIWDYAAGEYNEVLVGYDKNPEGEPHEPVFRYSVRLPEEAWFRQGTPGTVYWFTVTPVFEEPVADRPYSWGWTNHPHVSGEGALVVDYRLRMVPQWRPVRDPEDRAVDMSFEFFTVPSEGP